MIAALFVRGGGPYFGMDEVDPWPESRDARCYDGPYPVIAHPPCQRWGALSSVNYTRWGGEHNRPGNDGGCFESALKSVRGWGGVLEHPAKSRAFAAYGLEKPVFGKWSETDCGGYVTEVWQSAYGHKANKATWLYVCGTIPPALIWTKVKGTHQIGFQDQRGKERNKPTLSGKEAIDTPEDFKSLLISIAKSVYKDQRQ